MTHVDWIWKAEEDFTRQVGTSLKTKGKRKASTTRSHPPPLSHSQSVPLSALHQQVNTRKPVSLPSHNSKFSSPNLVTNGLTSPLRQARGMSTQADVKTEHINLGTTPFKHISMASGSDRGQLRERDEE